MRLISEVTNIGEVENVAMIKTVMYARDHAAALRGAFAEAAAGAGGDGSSSSSSSSSAPLDFGAWRVAHPFTPYDDEIYARFRAWLPDLAVAPLLSPAQNALLDPLLDREYWGPLSARFMDRVPERTLLTLLRLDPRGSYDDSSNVILVPRFKFYAVELARDREGATAANKRLRPGGEDCGAEDVLMGAGIDGASSTVRSGGGGGGGSAFELPADLASLLMADGDVLAAMADPRLVASLSGVMAEPTPEKLRALSRPGPGVDERLVRIFAKPQVVALVERWRRQFEAAAAATAAAAAADAAAGSAAAGGCAPGSVGVQAGLLVLRPTAAFSVLELPTAR
jgi:hypothetical protein